MAVWLTGPRRHWVVLWSFTPRLYSGILISLLFGLNDLLTLTLGSRKYFLPESPLVRKITCFTRRFWRHSTMFSRDLVPIAFATPYHRYIPMDKYIYLSLLCLFPVDLVITRYTEILSIVPRILCAYCLAVLCHLNTPMDNYSHLSSIRSSPDDSCISQ